MCAAEAFLAACGIQVEDKSASETEGSTHIIRQVWGFMLYVACFHIKTVMQRTGVKIPIPAVEFS